MVSITPEFDCDSSNTHPRTQQVRNLEKHLERIYRKVALEIVRGEEEEKQEFEIDAKNLHEYVGKPVFTSDRLWGSGEEKDEEGETIPSVPVGVTTGLAWTSMGGSTLYVETIGIDKGKGGLSTTGKLGEVMSESSKIAHTFARRKIHEIDGENEFFEKNELHLHVPEGATPKDGPSAGVTMVTSMLSLATNKVVPPNLAMTGEITLTGMVLPVGGIKEKIIAARRSNVNRLVLPHANRKDFEELPDYLRDGLSVRFARSYDDVYEEVWG